MSELPEPDRAPRVGDRVQVRAEHDETLRLMNLRTTPGTVSALYDNADGSLSVVVNLDSGQGVPYWAWELDRLA